MKASKNQTEPEGKKRDYAKPQIKKREQIKEVTETPVPLITMKTG
jgi:hypothetical protein